MADDLSKKVESMISNAKTLGKGVVLVLGLAKGADAMTTEQADSMLVDMTDYRHHGYVHSRNTSGENLYIYITPFWYVPNAGVRVGQTPFSSTEYGDSTYTTGYIRSHPHKFTMWFIDDTLTQAERDTLANSGNRGIFISTRYPNGEEKPDDVLRDEMAMSADTAGVYTGPPGVPQNLVINYAGRDDSGPLVRLTWDASEPFDWLGNPMPVSRYDVYGGDDLDSLVQDSSNLVAQTQDTFVVLPAASLKKFYYVTAQDTVSELAIPIPSPPGVLGGDGSSGGLHPALRQSRQRIDDYVSPRGSAVPGRRPEYRQRSQLRGGGR